IARADARGQQRQMQRAGAGVDGDAVQRALVRRELLLERLDLGAEDELAGLEHPRDGGGDVCLDGVVLSFQIDERNHAAHLLEENSMRRPDARIDSVAASSMRTTRRPECPSAIGVRLLAMQSTKWRA